MEIVSVVGSIEHVWSQYPSHHRLARHSLESANDSVACWILKTYVLGTVANLGGPKFSDAETTA